MSCLATTTFACVHACTGEGEGEVDDLSSEFVTRSVSVSSSGAEWKKEGGVMTIPLPGEVGVSDQAEMEAYMGQSVVVELMGQRGSVSVDADRDSVEHRALGESVLIGSECTVTCTVALGCTALPFVCVC